jgi:hypothetical protein
MAYIDNGDGTITVNGFKIAKPFGMKNAQQPSMAPTPMAINPAIAQAAMPGPDMRTAETVSFEVPGLRMPGGQPYQPKSVLDAAPTPPSPPDPRTAAIVDSLRQQGAAPMTLKPKDEEHPERIASSRGAEGGREMDRGLVGSQMSQARVISPGGMKTVAETTQKGVPITQELREQREGATMSARAANMAGYEAQAAEGEQSGEAARQYADETQRRLAEEQQRAVQHRDTLAAAQQKLESMQADYRSRPINDDTYWQQKGAGAKMAAGIWVALGNLSVQMTGRGENVAKSVIDKQVDSWVADQKERRNVALQGQQTAVGNIRQNFESESAQNAALRAQAYDAYRAKLGAIVGENAPEKLKAQALQLDAELQQKSADWGIQAAQAEADHVTTQSRLVGPTVVGGGGMKPLERGLVVQDLNGEKFLARDAEQARDLNKKHALTKTAIDAADTMRRISEKSATEKLDPNSPSGKEFGFAREQFTNSMNALAEQGVVRGDDIKRYEDYTGGAYGLSTAEASRKLASKAATAYSYNLSAKADTESAVDEEFGAGPNGTVDKYAHYRMVPGPNGSQIPIAAPGSGGGRKRKKPISFTPLGGQ